MKSFGVYYCYVKMPWCGCVEHGLEYIMFYAHNIQTFGGLVLVPRWFVKGH